MSRIRSRRVIISQKKKIIFFWRTMFSSVSNRERIPFKSRSTSTCAFVSWLSKIRDVMKRGREVYLKTPHLRHGVRTRMRKSTSTRHKTNMSRRRMSMADGTKSHVLTVFWMSHLIRTVSGSPLCTAPCCGAKKVRLPLPNLLAMPEDRLFIYQTTNENRKSKQTRRPRFT